MWAAREVKNGSRHHKARLDMHFTVGKQRRRGPGLIGRGAPLIRNLSLWNGVPTGTCTRLIQDCFCTSPERYSSCETLPETRLMGPHPCAVGTTWTDDPSVRGRAALAGQRADIETRQRRRLNPADVRPGASLTAVNARSPLAAFAVNTRCESTFCCARDSDCFIARISAICSSAESAMSADGCCASARSERSAIPPRLR